VEPKEIKEIVVNKKENKKSDIKNRYYQLVLILLHPQKRSFWVPCFLC